MTRPITRSATMIVAVMLICSMVVPTARVEAQTMSELPAMINRLMAQIAAMKDGNVNPSTPVPTTSSVPIGSNGGVAGNFAHFAQVDTTLEVDDTATLLKGRLKSVGHARNLNKVVLHVSPGKSNNYDMPWDVFGDIDITVNGYGVRSLDVDERAPWTKVEVKDGVPVYAITVYEGNVKLPAKSTPTYNVAIDVDDGADADTWNVWVPKNGITTWSAGTKHVSYGPSRVFTYTIEDEEVSASIEVYDNDVREVVVGENADGTVMVEYELGFEVAALHDDVYIPVNLQRQGVRYHIDGPSEENIAHTLLSRASKENGYYRIDEGDVEEFTLVVAHKPTVSGAYRLVMDAVAYLYAPAAQPTKADWHIYEVEDAGLKTEYVTVELATEEPEVGTAPGKNALSCKRSVTGKQAELPTGTLACYGMWDYGNDFGGDVQMCGQYGVGKVGCQIKAPMCSSGIAKATKYHDNAQLTGTILSTISDNLGVSEKVAEAGIAGLWEYTCQSANTGPIPVSTGAAQVLGATTDVYTEMLTTLSGLHDYLGTFK